MNLALDKAHHQGYAAFSMKEAKPFVKNDNAELIHRPRTVTLFNLHRLPHIAIKQWCGNTHAGMEKFTFLDKVPEDRVLCATCELRAVMAGRPPADEINGRHVHKGRLFVRVTCCHSGAENRWPPAEQGGK